MKKFDEFNAKFKSIFAFQRDIEVARALKIPLPTFSTMKKKDVIPYEQVVKFCEEKSIDLNWLLDLRR